MQASYIDTNEKNQSFYLTFTATCYYLYYFLLDGRDEKVLIWAGRAAARI